MKKLYLYLIIIFGCLGLEAEVPSVNGSFTLESGKYSIDISGKLNYCINKIDFDHVTLGNSNGFYGTILATAEGKFIGAGHKEGGKEKVIAIKLIVDGQVKTPGTETIFAGNEVTFEKISMLDNLKVKSIIQVTDDGIRIDKSFEAISTQQVYSLYVFQFCFSEHTGNWLVGQPDGSTREGNFKSDDGWHLRSQRELLWVALYDPDAGKGILGFFSSYYPGQGRYMLWDKKIYHKFYYWASLPSVIQAGEKSRKYSMVLRGISASPETWRKQAVTTAEELTKQYPLPKPPAMLTFNFEGPDGNCSSTSFKGEKCFQLKGNGKFLAGKIPLNLEKQQSYTIRLAIKKGRNTSSESGKNYLIVGQYDKNRKFKAFKTMGNNIPRDDKWHELKDEFKTPDSIEDCNLYIYNSETDDNLYLDEIEIKKINNRNM